jgi:hypothetical protein
VVVIVVGLAVFMRVHGVDAEEVVVQRVRLSSSFV